MGSEGREDGIVYKRTMYRGGEMQGWDGALSLSLDLDVTVTETHRKPSNLHGHWQAQRKDEFVSNRRPEEKRPTPEYGNGGANKSEDELPKGQADPTLRDQFLFRDLMFPVLLHRPLHDDERSVLEGESVRIDQ